MLNNAPIDGPNNYLYHSPDDSGVPGNYRKRPAGLLTQMRMVLLQPGQFFRFQVSDNSQHWLAAAFIILVLIGASAIRQQQLAPAAGSGGITPSTEGSGPDNGTGTNVSPSDDISMVWKPALTAASEKILDWVLLSLMLFIVSLTRMQSPQFGQNLRIVIWASVPLGLMAALQLLYYASGGQPGQSGLSGLVTKLPGFGNLPSLAQILLTSLSSHVTLFWLWSLVLVYLGARYTLGGIPIVIVSVLVLWIAWLVVLPVAVNSLNRQSTLPVPTVVPLPDANSTPTLGPS